MSDWSIEQARASYNIAHWGGGYYDVNERGRICVYPQREPQHGIDLTEVIERVHREGLSLPVLLRFNGILHDRVDSLVEAFTTAMETDSYQGNYTAVYPIKVNQQRSVVEQILHRGDEQVGLEAGSKPELLAVLGMIPRGGMVVCNGYKDREYIRLALIGKAIGHRVCIVVEKLSELKLILEESQALGVEPLLGLRVRLASLGSGKWQNSGGEKSKFGLSAAQVLYAVEWLRENGLLESLKLLHFHLGSQVANVRDIQRGAREVARFYAELYRLDVPLSIIDVGGGLAIDYEGTRSRSECSMNYTVGEYAHTIVHTLWDVCSEYELPHPHIITESGRAMTAHHAVLVTNVMEVEQAPENGQDTPPQEQDPLILHDLWRALQGLTGRSALETYHDAVHWLSEAQAMYTHGVLSLAQRAHAEEYYFAICRHVLSLLQPGRRAHREAIDELHEKLADKYFCNFSLFQSLPDVWGIRQIFPIMPLQRLDEPPTRRAVLQDLTCDSDGRIDDYVDSEGIESSLRVHALREGEPYLLGFFLVGAYQEILGDMHNLFGDTDSVNVVQEADGSYRLEGAERGDTVDDLLRYVHFDPVELMQAYRDKVDASALDEIQRRLFLEELGHGLEGYTYFEE
ncbi:MAG: biosynthetic arginine decarboxylase [Gammaproteobacteria bacterium]|nr:biosynthetic arginine decarboxylase [Gammaproteobacteria bacterium]MCW8972189.1 biosynthetic arginine decarboxylase [Gammaproteobacteria bacterium]MCW8991839.1 biosynthetic arginine decarboxylase [Gammaproteobacteria bacterium]